MQQNFDSFFFFLIGYVYNYFHEANSETYQPRLLDCKEDIIIGILLY